MRKNVRKHKRREFVTYESVARAGDDEISIPLGDFAVRFGSGEEERATRMTEALNQVRDMMRARVSGQAGPLFDPPLGLVVRPLLPA